VANELYAVLGVAKDATSGEIKSAYRALAKKHHPDLNPGDKLAEETFKNIQSTHAILEIDEEVLDVIFPLLDQVHGMRHELRRLANAIDAQPDHIRKSIVATLSETD
jgi:DnaJ-domain-containing protein 1